MMVEEVTDASSKEAGVWTPSKALIVATIGCLTFLISFSLLKVCALPELTQAGYRQFSEDLLMICVPLLAALVGYIAARALVVKGFRGFLKSISWRWSHRQVLAAIVVGVCATLLMRLWITGTVTGVYLRPRFEFHFVLVILGVVLAQPFVEEMYFRGILYAGLSRKIGSIWSICLITLIFVLGHPMHQWVVLPISILLAVARVATKSTASCFALHSAYNLGVVLWGIR